MENKNQTNPSADNFSPHLIQVLEYAKVEAEQAGSEFVDTEHLLLGVLSVPDEVIKKLLAELKQDVAALTDYVRYNLGGSKVPTKKEAIYSPRVKRVLELAEGERQGLAHHYVASEHLLLAILKEGEGEGSRMLQKFGVTYPSLKDIVVATVGQGTERNLKTTGTTPYLDRFGRDLLEEARSGRLDPVIGRATEIERTLHILARRKKNNPVLIGEPGVGKTAIVEGLAYRMLTGEIPETMKGKRLISISIHALLAGASKRGEFEERLEKVLAEARAADGRIILFFDEVHTLISGAGDTDTANILKPVLARGEIQMIGATTTQEYRIIEQDAALERRLQPVRVPEPSEEEALEIIKGVRDKYEAFHRVTLSDEILSAAIHLSVKYIYDRFLPDKALDLLDEAAARVRIPAMAVPETLRRAEAALADLEKEKTEAERNQAVDKLADLAKKEKELLIKKQEASEAVAESKARAHDRVQITDLEGVVAEWTGLPLQHIRGSERERLLKMEDYLHEWVIGQETAIKVISQAVRRGRAGLKKANRPVGSFVFLGTTGVGKTELAKTLARYLFGKEDAMIRFDMSEFMEKHAVFRLLGAPPGYVGYEAGGQLTEAVRKQPYSIVLFDEIEKADKEVFNILLQILDDGRLTDNRGRVVSFKNTIIICTSNLGSDYIATQFWGEEESIAPSATTALSTEVRSTGSLLSPDLTKMKQALVEILKKSFRPELINRFDDIVLFTPLRPEDMTAIVEVLMRETVANLAEQGITLKLSPAATAALANLGYEPAFGARPLKRVILERVDNALADQLLSGQLVAGEVILGDYTNGQFVFSKVAKTA